MELLDKISIRATGDAKTVELWQGDLTDMPPEEAVDVLVVSAFPDDYYPTHSSLIGTLYERGVSVADLAEHKEEDLRTNFGCWMSHEIENSTLGLEFRRILCFEPHYRGRPPEVVGDIFRSLAPFLVDDHPITTVAMPLVASGDVGEPAEAILGPLVQAATAWMKAGMPLRHLKIVERSPEKAERAREQFAELKGAIEPQFRSANSATAAPPSTSRKLYDLFISYCRSNSDAVDSMVEYLRSLRSDVTIFLDRLELDPGVAWQAKIYDALDGCRKVVSFYSPDYLASKMCQEEYNIARIREREEGGVLFPIYLYSAQLPASWRTINYEDCREADVARLRRAGEILVGTLGTTT